ncbi:MAG TPA: flavodoxin family protein [Nitrospirota bacterium]|nr:flavodoxin family protein [Nitrospirota bacterium]
MNIIAINGSPRKNWNTATLLEKVLEGAASQGANTTLVHLYDLNYKGCRSCFACKTKGGKSYGTCAVNDDVSPILKKIREADGLILGSPIYFGTVSGEMKSFMERLLFSVLSYTDPPVSLFPKKIQTGFIYTMNVTEEQSMNFSLERHVALNESYLKRIFGASESLLCFDTYQFDDYSKVIADRFDPEKKMKRRKEVFPKDCEKAFQMGVRFAH